ncbi:MAG: terminase small subunit [Acidaminococcales bacterium]|jgi:phage terminase small subunit|nr:terminase small subunit [Acidaminococcales bacterium]
MDLTEKQKRFIDFYVETGNATEAAKKAGYKAGSEKAYQNIGSENLGKLGVFIKERLAEIEDARIAGADEVLRVITSVLRSKKATNKDRLRAAELMGKRHGLFRDKVELSGADGGAVAFRWDDG